MNILYPDYTGDTGIAKGDFSNRSKLVLERKLQGQQKTKGTESQLYELTPQCQLEPARRSQFPPARGWLRVGWATRTHVDQRERKLTSRFSRGEKTPARTEFELD